MKKVLIISMSPLDRDPRVYRQILFLKEAGKFSVAAAGTKPSGLEDEFYLMHQPNRDPIWRSGPGRLVKAFQLKLGHHDAYYWSDQMIKRTYEILSDRDVTFDLVVANDIPVLPLALRIAESHNARVYLDAHEYQPRRNNQPRFNFFYRDYWHSICRRYLPRVDHMTTVNDGLAKEYSENFGVQCEVMMSLPFYEKMEPADRKDGRIQLVHHGTAVKDRRIENMIRLMKHLDSRFSLDFMMLGMESSYGRYLERIARSYGRIRFLPTVRMTDIPRAINAYDIGLYLLPPSTFNQKMSLPNKIFEYIQGRLALAIWPLQEMVKIVDKYHNGIYSSEFAIKQVANALNKLTFDDVARMKRNSHLAAQELNAEKTRKQLLDIVDSLLS